MKLAELIQDADGNWSLADFVPPLCSCADTPFLRDITRQIVQLLELAQTRALVAITDNTLCGEEIWAARTVLSQVCALRSLLAEIESGLSHHPYDLFDSLRQLALNIHCWLGEDLRDQVFAYQHQKFGQSIRRILEPTTACLSRTLPVARRVLHFVLQDRVYIADPLPAGLQKSNEIYLAIERREGVSVDISRLKLGAPGRLAFLRDYALPGIGVQACPPPTSLEVGRGNLDFFALDTDAEWAQAIQAGAIGFLDNGLPAKLRATLCWGGSK